MSQIDPTISFLSSPEILVSGLVYFLNGVVLLPTSSACSSPTPPRIHQERREAVIPDRIPHRFKPSQPQTELPPPHSPPPPAAPSPLPVEGYHTAVFVGPRPDAQKPWRVTVVLHGNYDRPEWQCETWQMVASFHGWILCPRGVPTYWAQKSEDRWMYRGAPHTAKEIQAALDALKAAYPGQVSDEEMVLVGFSLGAILSPAILQLMPKRFTTLFLIEGAVDKLDKHTLGAIKKSGIRAVGLAMSSGKYRTAAKQVTKWLKKLGMRTAFVNMAGAGHNYRADFTTKGREALRQLINSDESN